MITLNIEAVPNQSFSFDIDGVSFGVTLKTSDFTNATVTLGDEVIMSGMRVMPNAPIIPYEYLTEGAGNLFFIVERGEYPTYTEFGISQTLVYLTPEEIAELPNAY